MRVEGQVSRPYMGVCEKRGTLFEAPLTGLCGILGVYKWHPYVSELLMRLIQTLRAPIYPY